ncbi:unnamed protein product [Leuciscus chuanchicus]
MSTLGDILVRRDPCCGQPGSNLNPVHFSRIPLSEQNLRHCSKIPKLSTVHISSIPNRIFLSEGAMHSGGGHQAGVCVCVCVCARVPPRVHGVGAEPSWFVCAVHAPLMHCGLTNESPTRLSISRPHPTTRLHS